MILLAAATQSDMPNALVVLLCLLGSIVLILTIIGCSMGSQRKIVVYDSKADLVVTCVSIVTWVGSSIVVGSKVDASFAVWLVLMLSVILTINSIKRSVRANKTVWKGILSVFAKYAFVVLIVLSGMTAVFGAFAAMENVKKKDYKQAAANAGVAALGALGFMSLRKLISRLIAEPRPSVTNAGHSREKKT